MRGHRNPVEVVAIDGTRIPLPDTPANLSVFPKTKAGPNGPAGYPMLRLVTLVACGTRTLLDASFGTDATGERPTPVTGSG
ncbi:hypothetical protein ROS62_26430 [Streptomyces sp. DSM 41972]|uniref:Transposase n=1 Tax=Streptomyces althioticus subsp. attaecolombicae TaxID=3075534 RepID=A0ABU3I5J2_9ACTN|nr:hypothetical protein [Streptomyces sp. DSM 41972]